MARQLLPATDSGSRTHSGPAVSVARPVLPDDQTDDTTLRVGEFNNILLYEHRPILHRQRCLHMLFTYHDDHSADASTRRSARTTPRHSQ